MRLLDQILSKLARDRARLPANVILRKGARYVEELAFSSLYLHGCTSVGKRSRVRARPFIENFGKITIGDDFILVSLFVQSHLVTGHEGLLEIGNSVSINFGAAISAHERIQIGDRVRIGPYCIMMDSDYHTAKNRSERPTAPIIIEDDVWLAGRVSVLKGTHIGKNSVITAGSVVSGNIPSGVIAGGVPARVLGRIDSDDPAAFAWSAGPAVSAVASRTQRSATSVRVATSNTAEPSSASPIAETAAKSTNGTNGPPTVASARSDAPVLEAPRVEAITSVIAETFNLDLPIALELNRTDIAKWDSLGTLRLIMSLEERFGINIPETELVNMTSVGQVCRIVHDCLEGSA